jgi:transposase
MNLIPYTWKEAQRLQAWHLKQKGWSQRRIAEALGVSEGAVSQWMKRAHEAGLDALRRRPPPGAPRRLSADQLARLPDLERLPAYAPDLNPDEGLWQQLKGVKLRNLCCCNLPHLRRELRDAVKRVRRTPRLIKSFFRGARL